MSKKINLIGIKEGTLTCIKELSERNRDNEILYLFKCDCGKEISLSSRRFRLLKNKKCGIDCLLLSPIGTTYGSIKIIERSSVKDKWGYPCYLCRCKCGNEILRCWSYIKKYCKTGCGKACPYFKGTRKDLTNRRFGNLLVIGLAGKNNRGKLLWNTLCICGREIQVLGNSLQSGRTKSCGCINEADDIFTNIPKRRCSQYLKWLLMVKKRDNYTCQICNFNNGKKTGIAAHHLNSYSKFPAQRYDLSNGVTLCHDCHKKLHKKYGHKVIKENYEEFVKSIYIEK